jgi:prevent-host-death family protein
VATWHYDVATMATVSIRELKNRLSEHLRRLEDGETITVTRRGKPVALITPVKSREEHLSPGLRRLVAEGIIRWSGGKPQGLMPGIKLKGEGPTAAEIVIQGRD